MAEETFGLTDEDIEDIIDAYLAKQGLTADDADADAVSDAIDEALSDHLAAEDKKDADDFVGIGWCVKGCPALKGGVHNQECDDEFWARNKIKGGGSKDSGTFSWSKCRHEQKPYTLSDGTVILCSSHHHRDADMEPDLACYLDGIWTPATVAFHLGWQDYGLPYLSMEKVRVIADELLAAARSGKRVEIGCIGGHGRTGTFLAVLDLMTQPEGQRDAAATMKRVWAEYCSHAIESKDQEWYIEAWAATLDDKPVPAQPVKPKPQPKPIKMLPEKKAAAPKAKSKAKRKQSNRKAGSSRYHNRGGGKR